MREEKRGREEKDEQSGVVVDLRLRENIVAGGAERDNSAAGHGVYRYV